MNKILYMFLLLCLSTRCQYVNEYTSLTVPSFKVQDAYDSMDLSIMQRLFKMIEEKSITQIIKLKFNKETNINQRYFLSRGPHEPPMTCTPLCYAVYLSNVWHEEHKQKRGPFSNKNPFAKIIGILLEMGSDPNHDYPIFETVKTGNLIIFKQLANYKQFDPKRKYVRTSKMVLEEIEIRLKKEYIDKRNKSILQKMKKILGKKLKSTERDQS